MAYSENLAERIHQHFGDRHDVDEKKMFGGLCFMVANHMCCGIVGDSLMARIGKERYEECLKKKHVRKMDFTGRVMKGMVYVDPLGLKKKSDLKYWLETCEAFIKTL